eukprot:226820-Prorocentrum_minimum.AAC.2
MSPYPYSVNPYPYSGAVFSPGALSERGARALPPRLRGGPPLRGGPSSDSASAASGVGRRWWAGNEVTYLPAHEYESRPPRKHLGREEVAHGELVLESHRVGVTHGAHLPHREVRVLPVVRGCAEAVGKTLVEAHRRVAHLRVARLRYVVSAREEHGAERNTLRNFSSKMGHVEGFVLTTSFNPAAAKAQLASRSKANGWLSL